MSINSIVRLFSLLLLVGSSLQAYPSYEKYSVGSVKPGGVYRYFFNKIDANKVNSVFEIGSRDALDALMLSDYFQCHVFAFECNPVGINRCVHSIGDNPNVTLVPLAVWNKSGPLSFYAISTGNVGASSCFEFSPAAPNYQAILEEGLIQTEIEVNGTRLDQFLEREEIEGIDLICMDAQGAAYEVLEGLGEYIHQVKYIITEIEAQAIYSGEKLFEEVDAYLLNKGFERGSSPLSPNCLFGDVLYINKNIRKMK